MLSRALEILGDVSPWTLLIAAVLFSIYSIYIDTKYTDGSKHFDLSGSYDMAIVCTIETLLGAFAYSVGGSVLAIFVWFTAVVVSFPVLWVLVRKREKQNAWTADLLTAWAADGLQQQHRFHF